VVPDVWPLSFYLSPERPPEPPSGTPVRMVNLAAYAQPHDLTTSWYAFVSPQDLLSSENHLRLLRHIYDDCRCTHGEFYERIMPLLVFAAAYYQMTPSSLAHHHRFPGEGLTHVLEVVHHVLRSASRDAPPVGMDAPSQNARLLMWRMTLVYAAVMHDAAKPFESFRSLSPEYYSGRQRRIDPFSDEIFATTWAHNPLRETLYAFGQRHDIARHALIWRPSRTLNGHDQSRVPYVSAWLNKFSTLSSMTYTAQLTSLADSELWTLVGEADRTSAGRYLSVRPASHGMLIRQLILQRVRTGRWRPGDATPLKREGSLLGLALSTDIMGDLVNDMRADSALARLVVPVTAHTAMSLVDKMHQGGLLSTSRPEGDAAILWLSEDLSAEIEAIHRAVPPAPAATVSIPSSPSPPGRHDGTPPPSRAPGGTIDLAAHGDRVPHSNVAAPASTAASASIPARFLSYLHSYNLAQVVASDASPGQTSFPANVLLVEQRGRGLWVRREVIERFKKVHLPSIYFPEVVASLRGATEAVEEFLPPDQETVLWLRLTPAASADVLTGMRALAPSPPQQQKLDVTVLPAHVARFIASCETYVRGQYAEFAPFEDADTGNALLSTALLKFVFEPSAAAYTKLGFTPATACAQLSACGFGAVPTPAGLALNAPWQQLFVEARKHGTRQ
jgi:hypothetical protein